MVFIYSLDPVPVKTNQAKTQTSSTEREIVNESSEIKVIKLPDSSTVVLQPHSTIRISANFNKGDRAISLKGEAFFDVIRDETRPFKVFTHDVISTVLGTSFIDQSAVGK